MHYKTFKHICNQDPLRNLLYITLEKILLLYVTLQYALLIVYSYHTFYHLLFFPFFYYFNRLFPCY